MFVVCVADHVHSHVFDDGHVLGSAACSQPGQVVVKDDVEYPMEAIFDAPMASHGCGEGLGIELCGGKVESPFLLDTTVAFKADPPSPNVSDTRCNRSLCGMRSDCSCSLADIEAHGRRAGGA